MSGPIYTALWLGWAVACALGSRVVFRRLFLKNLGWLAKPTAYGMWIVLLVLGVFLVDLSGMQLYGYDPTDPRQAFGYFIFFFSPLGLPTLVGATIVLAFDLVVALLAELVRQRQRPS
ncbi:hypothetical protein D3C80_949820 [compost metagenome]